MRGSWRTARGAVCACLATLGLGSPAMAVQVPGSSVTLEWSPAAGELESYLIYVSTNGGPFLVQLGTSVPRVTLVGEPGDSLRVRVAAFGLEEGSPAIGPLSEASDLIILAEEAAESPPEPEPEVPAPEPDPDPPLEGGILEPPQAEAGWRFAAAGDFDGDGRPDLLTRNVETGQVQAWLLNGASIVGGGHLGWIEPDDRLHVGDYDGDGQSDLLVQRGRPEYPSIWFVSEAALRELRVLWDVKFWPEWRLSIGDFNADGRDDVFVLDAETGATEQLLLEGAELLAREPLPTLTDAGTRMPLPGDFDGDGLDDVLLFNQGQQEVWLSNASGPPSRQSLITTDGAQHVSTGDLDGDGRTDAIYHDPISGDVTVWYLDGSHRWSHGPLTSIPGDRTLESLDLDGDGRDDLLMHSPGGPELDYLLLR